jgi:phosphoglucomutase
VEVVDEVEDYLAVLKSVFDFPALKAFLSRPDFSLVFDAMHAVTGPYAKRILVQVRAADVMTAY